MAIAEQLRQEGQQGGAPSKMISASGKPSSRQAPTARQQGPKLGRNYDNSVWQQAADPAKAALKIPHRADPNCDPVTRLKTEPNWTWANRTQPSAATATQT